MSRQRDLSTLDKNYSSATSALIFLKKCVTLILGTFLQIDCEAVQLQHLLNIRI